MSVVLMIKASATTLIRCLVSGKIGHGLFGRKYLLARYLTHMGLFIGHDG